MPGSQIRVQYPYPTLPLALVLGLASASPAYAVGVFNIPHFVAPGQFALGLEPEAITSGGSGFGVNAVFTQGISDSTDVSAIVGSGTGDRRFRVGGNLVDDIIPDVEGQPGFGIAGQAVYYDMMDAGRLELTGIPYLHKNLVLDQNNDQVDPFLALPTGFAFSSGRYQVISNVAVGASFQNVDHLRYIFEIGVNLNHSDDYFSGGIVYYH